MKLESDISWEIIGAAIEVHSKLGPGLLESAYQTALGIEFLERRIPFKTEFPISVTYKGKIIERAFFADFLVDDEVIVELKSVAQIEPVHKAQVLTYLKFSRKRLGLLFNFNAYALRDGIKRIILSHN